MRWEFARDPVIMNAIRSYDQHGVNLVLFKELCGPVNTDTALSQALFEQKGEALMRTGGEEGSGLMGESGRWCWHIGIFPSR